MEAIKILYWSELSFDNVSFHPVFFFHPTLEILPFLEEKNYLNIPILIQNTNNLYDGLFYASIDKATSLGQCPVDFYKKKPIFSAKLSVPFTIFPYHPYIGEFFVLIDHKVIKNIRPQLVKDMMENCPPEPFMIENYEPSPENIKEEEIIPLIDVKEKKVKISKEEDDSTSQEKNLTYVFIICFFLVLIVVLILCFYGDLKK
jgi:hypothetical protein